MVANDPPTHRTRALMAASAPLRRTPTNYPEPFASRIRGREKRPLGDLFGLRSFGVNLTRLAPGGVSALHHRHSRQDEFIYILEGAPILVTDDGEQVVPAGTCFGFPAGGTAHHLENRASEDAIYLEIGDRSPGDQVTYPRDDLVAVLGGNRVWSFMHRDGEPY